MSEVSSEHSRQELEGLGFGPYEVNFVDSFVQALSVMIVSELGDKTFFLSGKQPVAILTQYKKCRLK